MKKIFVLLINLFLAANLLADEPMIIRRFPASSVKAVEVSSSGGNLTLIGADVSEATVEVYTSNHKWSDERIKQVFEEYYTIDVRVENGTLYAIVKPVKRIRADDRGLGISLEISVPRQTNSNLQTAGGSIHIDNLTGTQDFKTSGGSLSVNSVSGNVTGKTSGGSITVSNSKDQINLQTSGGSITATNCSGSILLQTSGGSLMMSRLNGNINASTSGGSIMVSGIDGTLKTQTSGGSVTIDDVSGNVDAHTSGGNMVVTMTSVDQSVKLSNNGSLSLVLPPVGGYKLDIKAHKITTSGLKDFSGSMDDESLEGTVGNGGPEIHVRASQRVNLSFGME